MANTIPETIVAETSLWHAPGTDQAGHVCAERFTAQCAVCGDVTVICRADRLTIVEILSGTFCCFRCADEPDGRLPAALGWAATVLLVACLSLGTVAWLSAMHVGGRGGW